MAGLNNEEKQELLQDFTHEITSGKLVAEQVAAKAAEAERRRKNRQFSDEEGFRPPVVTKPSGVYKPSGLPVGRVDKIPEEQC